MGQTAGQAKPGYIGRLIARICSAVISAPDGLKPLSAELVGALNNNWSSILKVRLSGIVANYTVALFASRSDGHNSGRYSFRDQLEDGRSNRGIEAGSTAVRLSPGTLDPGPLWSHRHRMIWQRANSLMT
jgi:hypothetical protein